MPFKVIYNKYISLTLVEVCIKPLQHSYIIRIMALQIKACNIELQKQMCINRLQSVFYTMPSNSMMYLQLTV